MKLNRKLPQAGFTLLESILVIVILGILSVFTFEFFHRSVEVYIIARENNRLCQVNRNAFLLISRDARGAQSGKITGGRLNLYNTQTTPLDDATELTYKLTGENLQRKRVTGTDRSTNLVAQQVEDFTSTISHHRDRRYLNTTLRLSDEEGGETELITGVSFYNHEDRFGGDWKELAVSE